MRWWIALVAVAACGRVGFRPHDGDGGTTDDARPLLGDSPQSDGAPTDSAMVDANPACPVSSPACQLCAVDASVTCTYEDTCCTCFEGTWICPPPNPPTCAPSPPTPGDGCAINGTTCYYDCQATSYQCLGHIWSVIPGFSDC